MSGHRIGVLICGPFLLGLAILSGTVTLGVEPWEMIQLVGVAGLGGWIIGQWR